MRSIMQMYTAMTVIKTSQREPTGDKEEPVVVSGVNIMNASGQKSPATLEQVSPGNTLFSLTAVWHWRQYAQGKPLHMSTPNIEI